MPNNSTRTGGALFWTVFSVGGLAAIAGGVWALGSGRDSGPAATSEVYTASATSFEITTVASGELRPREQTEIRCELEQEAAIVEVVKEGTIVKKGDMLVKISPDEVKRNLDDEMLQLEQSRAEVITAENALKIQQSDNDSSLSAARLKLEIAEIELRKWQEGDLMLKRQEQAVKIETTTREEERLRRRLANSEELYKQEFRSYDELERDRVAYIEAKNALEAAIREKEVYEVYEREKEVKRLTSDVSEAAAEVDRVLAKNDSGLKSREAELTNARRQLALREERTAKLQKQIELTEIRAPTDGMVVYAGSVSGGDFMVFDSRGPLTVGRQVYPNETLMVLPDTSGMIAVVKIHESLVGRVKEGQSATISVDALPGKTFLGSVQSIGIMAESGGWRDPNLREYEVKIALDPGEDLSSLKPSMRCQAEIVLGSVSQVVAVPVQAVFAEGPIQYVYVQQGGMYQRTPVEVGRRSDAYAELRSGVNEGDKVSLVVPSPARVSKDDLAQRAADAAPSGRGPRNGRPGPAAGDAPGGAAPAAQVVPTTAAAQGDQVTSDPPAEQADASDADAAAAETPAAAPTETTTGAVNAAAG